MTRKNTTSTKEKTMTTSTEGRHWFWRLPTWTEIAFGVPYAVLNVYVAFLFQHGHGWFGFVIAALVGTVVGAFGYATVDAILQMRRERKADAGV